MEQGPSRHSNEAMGDTDAVLGTPFLGQLGCVTMVEGFREIPSPELALGRCTKY
jgi:hypothetical protein